MFQKLIPFLFLIYCPWHDAYTLGQRGKISVGSYHSDSLTWAGLVNMVWILGLILWASRIIDWQEVKKVLTRKSSKPFSLQILVIFLIASLMLSVLNFKHFTSSGIVFILNWTLWSCLLLIATGFAPRIFYVLRGLFKKMTITLGISYAFALFLPLFIPIPNWRAPWISYGTYVRYGGWVGDGQVLGFIGANLFFWASVWLYSVGRSQSKDYLRPILFALIGLTGIYLNVLRLGWLMTSAFGFGMCFLHFSPKNQSKNRIPKYLAIGLALAAFSVCFTTEFRNKTRPLPTTPTSDDFEEYTEGEELGGTKRKRRKSMLSMLSSIENLEQVDRHLIHSNGRMLTYKILLDQWKKSPTFGIGTGGSKPALKQWKIDYHWPFAELTEPNSDYIRVLVEQGVCGLFIWLIIAATLIKNLKTGLEKILLGVLAIGLATDAMMILPTIGYGPFLMLLISAQVLTYDFFFTTAKTELPTGAQEKNL